MANYDLVDIMARLPVLQKRALDTIGVSSEAVNYWPYQQEGFPYWWNRIESMIPGEPLSGDISLHIYTVSMALVIAHLTGDAFKGESTYKAYTYIPAVLNYWHNENPRHLFDGSIYKSQPDGLWIDNGGAIITEIPNGNRALAASGLGTQQVALVFVLTIPLIFEEY